MQVPYSMPGMFIPKGLQLIKMPLDFSSPISFYILFLQTFMKQMLHPSFYISDFHFILIQERLLRHFSTLFFGFKKEEKKEHFSLKPPFIHFFEPCIPTRTCFKWALSLSLTRRTTRKDTVICFTYFLVSFLFYHLVILPSFSRRKLKWKEKS